MAAFPRRRLKTMLAAKRSTTSDAQGPQDDPPNGRDGKGGGVQGALVQSAYGQAADVLSLSAHHPILAPLPTQVQIRVHAASLNPIDWQMLEGNRRLIDRRTFPFVPFFDVAGVVMAVGAAVTRFKIGDAVHADNEKGGGGASEVVNVEQDLVSLKPKSLSFSEAAAVPLAGQTALLTLDKGMVRQGSRVCIIGASGGVGCFAVQMAKALGASYVVGVCSGKNDAFVKSLGADETIDYTKTTLAHALHDRRVDVVIDCVGGRDQWMQAQKVLLPKGRFVTISRDEDAEVTVASGLRMVVTITARRVRSFWGNKIAYVPVFLKASSTLLDRVDGLIATGKVKVPVQSRCEFDLDSVVALIQESKRGRMVGKSVVDIIPDTVRP